MDFKQYRFIFYTYWTKEVISKNLWLNFTSNTTHLIRNLLWPLRSLVFNLKPKHLGFPKDFTNLAEISFTLWILYYHQITSIGHKHYHTNTNVAMSLQHNRKHSKLFHDWSIVSCFVFSAILCGYNCSKTLCVEQSFSRNFSPTLGGRGCSNIVLKTQKILNNDEWTLKEN